MKYILMIKKFNEYNTFSENKYPYTPKERFDTNIDIFKMVMSKLSEILDGQMDKSENPDWGDVGNIYRINEVLIDTIEGYDEELAGELRQMMKIKFEDL